MIWEDWCKQQLPRQRLWLGRKKIWRVSPSPVRAVWEQKTSTDQSPTILHSSSTSSLEMNSRSQWTALSSLSRQSTTMKSLDPMYTSNWTRMRSLDTDVISNPFALRWSEWSTPLSVKSAPTSLSVCMLLQCESETSLSCEFTWPKREK